MLPRRKEKKDYMSWADYSDMVKTCWKVPKYKKCEADCYDVLKKINKT